MSCSILLRAALAVSNPSLQERFQDELIRWAVSSGNEIDIAFPIQKIDGLEKLITEYDLIIADGLALSPIKDNLINVFRRNPCCFTIFANMPPENVCEFLDIRPVGYVCAGEERSKIAKYAYMQAEDLQKNNRVYQISTREGIHSVTVSEILFCQSDLKYVVITTVQGRSYRKLGTLNALQKELPIDFIRIHQSFLVNKHLICGMDKANHLLLLQGDRSVPFSKAYANEVHMLFQKYPNYNQF